MAKQTFTTGQVLTAAQMTSLQQTAMGGGSTTAKTASYVLVAADAGTVVQMNSASATTITVNTALFAAGDTIQIQNVGAGVCTVTAGTATVNTSSTLALKQYDAGSLYFNSTSAAIFFATDAADSTSPLTTKGDLYGFSTLDARIPIGTNNQVLTADSAQALGLKWATPASGGKVLQVVNMTPLTAEQSTTSATYADVTGFTATITPTSNTSTIFCIASISAAAIGNPEAGAGFRLLRTSTAIWTNNQFADALNSSTTMYIFGSGAITVLDAPATTSATTYKVQFKKTVGTTAYLNYSGGGTSTLTLFEIGA